MANYNNRLPYARELQHGASGLGQNGAMTIRTRAPLFALLFLPLTGCFDSPSKLAEKKAAETPDPPLTGRQAFQRMFPQARAWAIDAQPLQLQSYNLPAVKSAAGKAGAWQATFISLSRHRSRTYSWSAVEAEGNLHKGVFAGPEQSYSGPTGQESPFEIAAIRVDSDAAWEAAAKHKDTIVFLKKFPHTPVLYILEKTRRFPDLAWRVLFGESVSTSEYSVFIDATTGQYLERTR